jgi:hypothetical protein
VEAIFILRDGREISAEYITMLYKAPDSYVGTPKMLLGREIYYCIKENGVEIQRTFDFSEIESMEISAFGPKTYCL